MAVFFLVRAVQLDRSGSSGGETGWDPSRVGSDNAGPRVENKSGMIVLYVLGGGIIAVGSGLLALTFWVMWKKVRRGGSVDEK